jgi:hypothetical protein
MANCLLKDSFPPYWSTTVRTTVKKRNIQMRRIGFIVPFAGLLGLASVSVATSEDQPRVVDQASKVGQASEVDFFNRQSAPPGPVNTLPGDAGPVNTKANDMQTQEIARIAGVPVKEVEAQREYRSLIGPANQAAATKFAEEYGGLKIEPLPSRKVWVAVTGDRPSDAIRAVFEPFEVEYVTQSLSEGFVQKLRNKYLPQQIAVEFDAFEQKLTLYSDNPNLLIDDSIPDQIEVKILSKDRVAKIENATLMVAWWCGKTTVHGHRLVRVASA